MPAQGQWALVLRQFFKRRLAVVAACVIFSLVTISILAPFLANDRPLYYVGINRFEYQEAARTLRGTVGQLVEIKSSGKSDRASQIELIQATRLQTKLMLKALSGDSRSKLTQLQSQIELSISAEDRDQSISTLRGLQREIRSEFDGKSVVLQTRSHWPVFASLAWTDIFFLVGVGLVITNPIWSRSIGRTKGSLSTSVASRWLYFVVVGLPFACSVLWWLMVPQRVDRTDYKSGVLSSDDSDKLAPVVYETVMWPPIAFGLDENDLAGKSSPPAWYSKSKTVDGRKVSRWSGSHWLGTDELGRDVLCRMIWGGRVSLTVGMVAVAIYVSIGIVVGSIAGYFRGVCDLVISRIIEVVICFPAFFLILTIVAMVGPGLFNIMIVIGLTGWTGIARLVRGEFLRLVDQEFVLAAKSLGYSPVRIIFRHVLPNALAPVLVSATFGVAGAILTESSLSFLGLGITVPTPSWGGILADGRQALLRAPWLIHFPGLAIFATITSYNLVGEALRDAVDPRLRGSR